MCVCGCVWLCGCVCVWLCAHHGRTVGLVLARAVPDTSIETQSGVIRVAPVFDPEIPHDVVLATSPATTRAELLQWAALFRLMNLSYSLWDVEREHGFGASEMEYNGRVRAINWARGGANVFIVPRSSDPHHMDSLATMSCQQLRAHCGGPGTGFVGVAAAAAAAGVDVDVDAGAGAGAGEGAGAGAGAGAHDDQPLGLAEALWCPGNAHAGKCGLLLVGWQESDLAHALFDSNAAETRDVPW